MHLDFSDFTAAQRYHLMTQTIIPRPIAWALTDSDNGSYNLAPFSYFTAVSSEPALLMLSVGKKAMEIIKIP
jgi:flavin reductase (DIM6/NTAB) family NADH-FMN oxidoreductase RutF